jgi:hypothetical protein
MRLFLILSLFLSFGVLRAETVRERVKNDPKFQLYAVIFGVTQNSDGTVKKVRVVDVLDATSDSKDTVKLELPPRYLSKASRAIYEKKYPLNKKDGKVTEFAVYFFYSPQLGEALITDADADISTYPRQ